MKILIVNKFYYNRGGDCIYAINLSRILKASGNEIAVFSMQYPQNIETEYSDYFASEVSFTKGFGGKLAAAARILGGHGVKESFQKILDRFKPDVVHFNNIHSYLSPIIVEQAKKAGAKTVWTLHDYKLVCPAYSCLRSDKVCEECVGGSKFGVVRNKCMKGGIAGNLLGYAESRLWNRKRLEKATDVFICPSRFIAGKMLQDGFNPEKIKVLNNFVPREMATGKIVETPRSQYYAYVGRLSREKGVETLLKAASDLPYKLKVAGGGPLSDELKAKYGKSPNIEFLGHISPSEVKNLVASAKFTVISSEWYENNPLSVIESLCLGTPVVGAKIGGIPELIQPGNGFLFRSGDKESLSKTLRTAWDSDFDHRMISEKSLERFSESLYIKQLSDIYSN